MQVRYHINKHGVPTICKAKPGNCPLGNEGKHFSTHKEAQEFINKENQGQYGLFLELKEELGNLSSRVNMVEDLVLPKITQTLEEVERNNTKAKLNKLQRQLDEKERSGIEFTDEEISERALIVNEVMGSQWIKELDTSKTYGYLSEDCEFGFTDERTIKHEHLFAKLNEKFKDVPSDGKVVISAGMPGSGKTYTIKETGDINLDEYAVVNSDDFKEMLAEEDLIPKVKGLTPMERVSLVHKESSYLLEEMSRRLRNENKNIILDMTCQDLSKTKRRINVVKKDGYKSENITMICVKTNPDVARERAIGRHKEGMNEYISGLNKIGGRIVPNFVFEESLPKSGLVNPDNIDSEIYPNGYETSSEQVYDLILKDKDIGIKGIMYDNSVYGRKPRKIEELTFL